MQLMNLTLHMLLKILYTTVMRAKEVRGISVITSIYPGQRFFVLCSNVCNLFTDDTLYNQTRFLFLYL